ncbi:GNAT family N-acetyltransferase [Limnochorda pilosa]|uniref:Acetyltransferase n=1 Tax=Limnochorda pilosa TaxID=1555112 RepID=A0A0K2SI65_LIMPI|nr:GNAT family N-acetyltransferase [Limnochorda pilosa]BAS26821.1 acetyltransferase [Limnochorda pilosa]
MFIQGDAGVHLRSWQTADAQWYIEARDEEVYRWTTERRELTVAETEAAIEAVNKGDNVFSFAIVETKSNEILGNISLVRDEDNAATGEAMYWLAASARGRGIATEALRLLCHWALAEEGFDRITLKTYANNVRSQRVAERVGFRPFQPSDQQGTESGVCWYQLTRKEAEIAKTMPNKRFQRTP